MRFTSFAWFVKISDVYPGGRSGQSASFDFRFITYITTYNPCTVGTGGGGGGGGRASQSTGTGDGGNGGAANDGTAGGPGGTGFAGSSGTNGADGADGTAGAAGSNFVLGAGAYFQAGGQGTNGTDGKGGTGGGGGKGGNAYIVLPDNLCRQAAGVEAEAVAEAREANLAPAAMEAVVHLRFICIKMEPEAGWLILC